MTRFCSKTPLAAVASALAAVALCAGCATNNQEAYEDRLRATQPFPRAVTFDVTTTYPGDVLCGVYSSLSPDGFRSITGDFAITPTSTLPAPSELETLIYCSDRSEELLFSRLGIGGDEATWEALTAIRDDMQAIDAAIIAFFNTTQAMPFTLDQLAKDGFLSETATLTDPWDQPYLYEPGLTGRTTPKYRLATYGRDGQPGGTGPDADISEDNRAFVEHVLRVKKR